MAQDYYTAGYSAKSEPYFQSLLGRAQIAAAQPYEEYEGKRFADFTPDQLAYIRDVRGLKQDPRTLAAASRTQAGISALYGQEYKPTEFTAGAGINPRDLQQLQMGAGKGIATPKDYRDQINAAEAAQGAYGQQFQNYLLGAGQRVSGAGDFRDEINQGQAAQGTYNQQIQNYLLGAGQRIQAPEEWEAARATAQQGTYDEKLQNYLLGAGQRIQAPENLAQDAARMYAAQTDFKGGIGTRSFTDAGRAESYMSPYMQNVVEIQQREAQRQADIEAQTRAARAVQSGAFGGSRQAIERAEAARNLAQQKGDIQAKGLQEGYAQAQQQFGQEEQNRLTAQQANQQANLQASLANLDKSQQARVQNQAAMLQMQGMSAEQAMRAAQLNMQDQLSRQQANQQAQLGVQQLMSGNRQQLSLQNLSNRQQAEMDNAARQFEAQGMTKQQAMQVAQMNMQDQLARQQANQQAQMSTQELKSGQAQQMDMQNLANQQQMAIENASRDFEALGMTKQQAMQAAQMNMQDQLARQQANQQAQLGVQELRSGQVQQMNMQNLSNRQQAEMENASRDFQALGMTQEQAFQAAQLRMQDQLARDQANYQGRLGIQQLGAQQNLEAQQANQQARFEAQRMAEQSRQFGANFGYQGQVAGLQGAGQLNEIGQNLYGQNIGNMGLQQDIGKQQQNLNQNRLDAQYNDWLNKQNQPFKSIEFESNIFRGLANPTGQQNMYTAPPSMFNQLAGAGMAAYGMGQMQQRPGFSFNLGGNAAGGLIDLAMSRAAA